MIGRHRPTKLFPLLAAVILLPVGATPPLAQPAGPPRPHYSIDATIDYALMTLQGTAVVTVPVAAGDSLSDAIFFIYADAPGVGGVDGKQHNISVDSVTDDAGANPGFTLEGAVLRVKLSMRQTRNFNLKV